MACEVHSEGRPPHTRNKACAEGETAPPEGTRRRSVAIPATRQMGQAGRGGTEARLRRRAVNGPERGGHSKTVSAKRKAGGSRLLSALAASAPVLDMRTGTPQRCQNNRRRPRGKSPLGAFAFAFSDASQPRQLAFVSFEGTACLEVELGASAPALVRPLLKRPALREMAGTSAGAPAKRGCLACRFLAAAAPSV